jgi:hypothetical protein
MDRLRWVIENTCSRPGLSAFNSLNMGTAEHKCYMKKQSDVSGVSGLKGAAARAKAEAQRKANADRRYFVFQVNTRAHAFVGKICTDESCNNSFNDQHFCFSSCMAPFTPTFHLCVCMTTPQVRPTGSGKFERALRYYDSIDKYRTSPGFPNGTTSTWAYA